ncbi:MAG TPA: nuclear transport factor 2 family protein [Dermatophilaceae bacterium]|nr:nuclear transport factor 2 family protein [Dermatophilaceae bacterium]
MTTLTDPGTDIGVVRSAFAALGRGDVAGFADMFHPEATWNHRNQDRLGGVHVGRDGIIEFVTQSAQLTGGTLRPVPQVFMSDGQGTVSVVVQVSGTRPDGRAFDDLQMLLLSVDDSHVRRVDQFVGNPSAVKAFWA